MSRVVDQVSRVVDRVSCALGRACGVRIERRSGPPSARASGRDWNRLVRGPCEKARRARDERARVARDERARLAGSGYDPRLATVRRANDPPAAPRSWPGADERRARESASAAALSGRRRREPRPLAATTRSASAAGNMSEAAAGTNLTVASYAERGPVGRTRRCGRRGGVIDPRPSRTHCLGSRRVGVPHPPPPRSPHVNRVTGVRPAPAPGAPARPPIFFGSSSITSSTRGVRSSQQYTLSN